MKILVVEDHPKIRENIITFLKLNNFVAEWAVHGEEALEKVGVWKYDVIVLDINMPVMNGKQFLQALKVSGKSIPVLALTSNSMLEDKLEMFELGVQDYMTKPFELKELLVRIQVLGSRKENIKEETIIIWDIEINVSKHKIYKKKKELEIWNKEYLIIELLALNKWYPQSKVTLLEKVWGEQEENLNLNSTTLEAHISVLRKKIWKSFIKTIKGVWYVID